MSNQSSAQSSVPTRNDEINGTVNERTKGYIFENDTNKVFHVVSWRGEYPGAAFENPFKPGTPLTPGAEHRWEMLYRWQILPSTYRAWVTYGTDDGIRITVGLEGDFSNTGTVFSVSIESPTPITCELGYKNAAHLIKIMTG